MAKKISGMPVRWMFNYYYLVSFCPQQHVAALKKAGKGTLAKLGKQAGLKPKEFVSAVAPEVARRVVAFQQATRKPEAETVQ